MAALDSGTFDIQRLFSVNYRTWEYRMEMLKLKENIWNLYSLVPSPSEAGSAAWIRKYGKVKGLIGLLVDTGQIGEIEKFWTDREIWHTFTKCHKKCIVISMVILLRTIYTTHLAEGGDGEKHLMDLSNFGNSSDIMVTVFDTRPDMELTLAIVQNNMMTDLNRRQGNELMDGSNSQTMKVNTFGIEFSQESREQVKQVNNSGIECFFFLQRGHGKFECSKW